MTALPTPPTTEPLEHRVLRRDEVEHKTGLKRAHIYTLMRTGQFPKTIPLGKRAVGWDSWEIEQWIADRCSERS